LTEIRIYYEGDKALTPGFRKFLSEIYDRARAKPCKVQLIATDGTPSEDFANAIDSHPHAWNILLLDSEGPDNGQLTSSLIAQRGWPNSHQGSIFWMVEMMEAWFHADKGAIEGFYREGFNKQAMKANPKVEQISKKDLEDGLKAATKDTLKGKYHKINHAPRLLEVIDPSRVRDAAPNCRRLFDAVLAKL
jgi:hypothetical protein